MTSSLSSVELITACWAQKVPKVGFGLERRNPENEELCVWGGLYQCLWNHSLLGDFLFVSLKDSMSNDPEYALKFFSSNIRLLWMSLRQLALDV